MLFFDEEPILDFTDWNLVHVFLFTFSLMATLAELTLRARFGQHAYKDQSTLAAVLTFWFGIEAYFRAVVIVFSWHSLTPLECELFEACEVYSLAAHWLTTEILPSLFALGLALSLLLMLNLSLGWARWQVFFLQYVLLVLGLLWACVSLAWDLVLVGLSSVWADASPMTLYPQTRSSLTYDHQLSTTDRFDWHKETQLPFVARFEDLFFFSLQLFTLVSLYCALVVAGFFLLDLLQAPQRCLSYTQLSIVGLWLEHVVWAYVSIFFTFGLISYRVACRVPYEFLWLF